MAAKKLAAPPDGTKFRRPYPWELEAASGKRRSCKASKAKKGADGNDIAIDLTAGDDASVVIDLTGTADLDAAFA